MIIKDERYKNLVKHYQNEPLKFAVNVCGLVPSKDQAQLLNDISPKGAKVSVVSGTGTGKTNVFARIAFWHLICFPFSFYDGKIEVGSNTYIGAPRIKQVSDGVWKELNDIRMAVSLTPYAWLNDYYEITKTKVYIKGYSEQWFISQIALQQGQSIGVAGKHRYWQLIIIDEAAGVSDEHFDVIDGTQTQEGNRTLIASQGVRNAGRFYESHFNLSKNNGGSWTSLCFSSINSPFVTRKWIKERARESGGVDSIEYRIRVLGQFAEDSGSNLLTRVEIEKCFELTDIIREEEPYGLFVLSDIGLGEYRDDSVAIVCKVIGDYEKRRIEVISIPICTNSKDEIIVSGDLVDIMGKLSNPTLLIDNGGVGATVTKLIEASGTPLERVNWGKPCFKKEYRERFYNQRAQAMVCLRDAIREGRVSITTDMDNYLREKILLQGSRLPYHFAENGGLRYQMDKKEVMRKNGISSPDIFDALSFAFLEDAYYMEAHNKKEQVSDLNSFFDELE